MNWDLNRYGWTASETRMLERLMARVEAAVDTFKAGEAYGLVAPHGPLHSDEIRAYTAARRIQNASGGALPSHLQEDLSRELLGRLRSLHGHTPTPQTGEAKVPVAGASSRALVAL